MSITASDPTASPRSRGRWETAGSALSARVVVVAVITMIIGMVTGWAAPAQAATSDPSQLAFTVTDGDATITGFKEDVDVTEVTNLVIPSTVSEEGESWPVTAVSDAAFQYGSLTSVEFPTGLRRVGNSAFSGNALSGTLVLPDSLVTAGRNAFDDNQLTGVRFGSGLTKVGTNMFRGNRLTVVTLPDSITAVGAQAFAHNRLTSVDLGRSVTAIGESAFEGTGSDEPTNQITSVAFPDSLTAIGEAAFFGNALTKVTLPQRVRSLGAFAFSRNHLTEATLPASLSSIPERAFEDNELTKVTIPATVTAIGEGAFADNPLASVLIEGSGVSVSAEAFTRVQGESDETTFKTVTFTGAAPAKFAGWNGRSGAFLSFSLDGVPISRPAVVYPPEQDATVVGAGGFTTPAWKGYPAAPAGTDAPVVPAAPTVDVEGATVTVNWSPPAEGPAVTGYRVRLVPAFDDSADVIVKDELPATASSVVFEGVRADTYRAFVTAHTGAGDLPESLGSPEFEVSGASVTAPAKANAPQVAKIDGASATIWIHRPQSDGGSPITSYTLTLTPEAGSPVSKTYPADDLTFFPNGGNTSTTVTVRDLRAGTYRATVYATNNVGDAEPSDPSTTFTITADEPTGPAQHVAAEIKAGNKIVVSGTGWQTADGKKGSIIAFKLDDGAVTRTFDLSYPEDSTASDAFKANRTIWGVVQADATGTWSVELPYPTAANSDADLSGWTDGSTHKVRLLSGSLLTDDETRSVGLSFKVTGSLPDQPVSTTIKAGPVSQVYGRSAKLAVSVSPKATGKVSVKVGSRTVTGELAKSKATLTLPAKALRPGTHTLTVSYAGTSGFKASSAIAKVTVRRAVPTVKVTIAKKVKRGKTVKVEVAVKAPGITPGGNVAVKIAGAKKMTVKLNAKGKAVVKVKLPKGLKPGKKKVVVTYTGDAYTAKATAKATRINVTR